MVINSKTVLINFEDTVQVGNGAIQATLVGQAWVNVNDTIDIEFIDVTDVSFMGVPIESNYEAYKKFKTTMLSLGIDVDELFDKKFEEIVTEEFKDELKRMY